MASQEKTLHRGLVKSAGLLEAITLRVLSLCVLFG